MTFEPNRRLMGPSAAVWAPVEDGAEGDAYAA
jgi:hypothetical protein